MGRRSMHLIACSAVLTLGAAACTSGNDDASEPSSDQADTATTQAAAEEGHCATDITLTVTTDSGTIEFDPVSAYADVTLDSSINVTIGNYEISPVDAEGVYQPSLTGDQAAVIFYVSAAQGATLATGSYPEVGTEPGQYQLNNYSVYAPQRVIATGLDVPESVVEITEIGKTQVCGSITSGEVTGNFVAVRI